MLNSNCDSIKRLVEDDSPRLIDKKQAREEDSGECNAPPLQTCRRSSRNFTIGSPHLLLVYSNPLFNYTASVVPLLTQQNPVWLTPDLLQDYLLHLALLPLRLLGPLLPWSCSTTIASTNTVATVTLPLPLAAVPPRTTRGLETSDDTTSAAPRVNTRPRLRISEQSEVLDRFVLSWLGGGLAYMNSLPSEILITKGSTLIAKVLSPRDHRTFYFLGFWVLCGHCICTLDCSRIETLAKKLMATV
ncbi:hypothetical protein Ddye_023417 [Dipteronia dyeriana]|uniref:Uncharacterized protein n=1 Tax=Dipteronia dyeriana TaxID=168575 RepID=A0AAD9WS34_9ROSI|nr:hypothetical protein Ddye_023417 [Dipteronia dyeriana]